MSPLNITQPLGIWSTRWLLFQVMSNIPKMGQLPTPVWDVFFGKIMMALFQKILSIWCQRNRLLEMADLSSDSNDFFGISPTISFSFVANIDPVYVFLCISWLNPHWNINNISSYGKLMNISHIILGSGCWIRNPPFWSTEKWLALNTPDMAAKLVDQR